MKTAIPRSHSIPAPLVALATVLMILVAAGDAAAVDGCKVKVSKRDGVISVNAKNVNGLLSWGDDLFTANQAFANELTCVTGGKAKSCLLADTFDPAAKTPPAGCEIWLADSASACSAWVPGCTPGARVPVAGGSIDADSVGADRLAAYFVVTGSETLTQPEFSVAGFNTVVAEANLTVANPIIGTATDSTEPLVFVSVRTGAPIPDEFGVAAFEYKGDVRWNLVAKNVPEQAPAAREIGYGLQFRLETSPQPPQSNGQPAPGDPAPEGSQVVVYYRAVFARFDTP